MGLWREIWILTSARRRIRSASFQTCPDSIFARMPNLPFVGYWAQGESETSLKTGFQVRPFCYMADVSFPVRLECGRNSSFVY